MKHLKNPLNRLSRSRNGRNQRKKKTLSTPYDGLSGGVKRGLRFYAAFVLAFAIALTFSMTAFASGGDPLQTVNNLSDFIFGLIRAIGLILLGFGIVQIGLSLKSHDPSQRANGFLTLAGGVIIFFAKEILDLITG